MVAYLLWRLATALIRRVPLRTAYAGAVVVADLVFLFWREKRQNAIDNMRHVLAHSGESVARRTARDSFRNYGRYLVDFARSATTSAAQLTDRVQFDQWDIVDAAFREGKGIIFVLMHFGNWDWGGALFSQKGYILNVVAQTFEHNRLNDMVVAARTHSGMRVLPMERTALPLIRALRRNEALAILIDRPGAANGVSARFFGREAILPAGPARLALRTGARVLAVALVRLCPSDDRLKAMILSTITSERTADEEYDVKSLTETMLQAHEALIREFPDQWYMFRRMWPANAPPVSSSSVV